MPLQLVGNGAPQVSPLKPPRFDPVMFATIPGAIGPATCDAAFNTPALVKLGVCA
jgi:hypothetical protein